MEEKMKKVIEKINKFKLIEIISSIYYYFKVIGDYNNMLSTGELEYIINLIYKTKNTEERIPTKEDVLSILEMTKLIILEKESEYVEVKEQRDIIFSQTKNHFLHSREDTEYDSIIFEYLNLFNPMEEFFKTYYSFKIENFLYFMKLIQIEYSNRMFLLDKTLKKIYKKVTRDIFIEYILNCGFGILNFNEKTLADSNENLIAFKNILRKFSVNKNECIEKDFENFPIYKNENTYILSSVVTLIYKAKYIFEKEIRKDKFLKDLYAYKKGEYLEILTENVMKDILKNAKIFPNIKYRENKMDRECDMLVIFDQVMLIVEIKARAFKEVSKGGMKKYLREDLKDNIYNAYKQATRMEKYLLKNKVVTLRYGSGGNTLKIENIDKFKIFKIGITLENFREYAVQYTEFENDIKHDMVFFNINDLKFMSRYFKYESEFIHYIVQRIKTNQYINEFYLYDELYLFSEYKINNLQSILNNDHKVKVFDTGRYKLFDLRFNQDKKEKILNGFTHPFIDRIIKELESRKVATYELMIIELLDLDYNAQKYLFEQLNLAREKFKENGKVTHTAIFVEKDRDFNGLYVVFGVGDKNQKKDNIEGTIVFGSIIKRKYPDYNVIGVINNIEDSPENIYECINILKPKKDFDKYLEKIKELKDMYSQI